MNKTAQTELHRLFLIDGLPEPLMPASSHLQLFDNYIENTTYTITGASGIYFLTVANENGSKKIVKVVKN